MNAGGMEGGGGSCENLLRPPSSSLPPLPPTHPSLLFPSPHPRSLGCKLMHPNAPSSLSSLLVLRHFRFWFPPISPPVSPHSSPFPPHCVPSLTLPHSLLRCILSSQTNVESISLYTRPSTFSEDRFGRISYVRGLVHARNPKTHKTRPPKRID